MTSNRLLLVAKVIFWAVAVVVRVMRFGVVGVGVDGENAIEY